jgi:Flp pilus assembly protein TadD
MIYSQIDMVGLKDRDELLASFDGDAEKAIKSLEMSIRSLEGIGKKDELAKNMNKLAGIYDYVGRRDEAEKEYRDALRINPDFADAHYNLGVLLGNKGRKEDAEAEYRESLRINPDDAEAHNNLGVLLDHRGRKEDAEVEYRETLRINPDSAVAHYNLGILYSKTGKKEEAKKELEIAKRLFDEQGRETDAKKAEELLNTLNV